MGKPLPASDIRRFRALPPGTSVHEIADLARAALVAFVAGTSGGWSRVDLARWLIDHYRPSTRAFPRQSSARTALALGDLGPAFETCLMDIASIVREDLASCSSLRTMPDFVDDMVGRELVVPCRDNAGALGYVPVDVDGMSLIDCVSSLLAADFLTRPNDYRGVALCEDCGVVAFAWTACEHERCAELRESGVIRHDDAPPSYASIFPPRAN